ncbi:MAG: hypothetical protein IPO88_03870 [Nannocystis sp.]|uniref:hypothetical protein n=1 Tax=Nannocystis sp. TaxID=1962667 RepID=UPI0024285FE1|nr:hypothetical protein [Nannocystis sp.]MBK9752639.1 hypothetical protein [Nannocystis sp.]
MNKLCVTFLSLALGVPALAHARDDKTPSLPEATAAKTAAGASIAASASATITVSDQDALGDDILSVINLPIAAADAREAGVDEAELKEALDTTRDSGLSAGDAGEIVAVEAEQTRSRGVKKGFGRWVRLQVAAGLRGKKLAAKIKERKQDTGEFDEKQLADLREKLEKQRELNKQWREKLRERQGELLTKGKKRVLLHEDRNEKFKAKLDAGKAKNSENHDALELRLRALDQRIADAAEADKAALQAEKDRLEKALKHNEKVGDKLDKAEERADKREDRLEKREDRLDKVDDKKGDHPKDGHPPALDHDPGKAHHKGPKPKPAD